MGHVVATPGSRYFVRIIGDTSQLRRGLNDARGQVDRFSRSIAGPLRVLSTAGGIAGALGIGSLAAAIDPLKRVADAVDDIGKKAAAVGVSTEFLSATRFAASFANVTSQEVDNALGKLNRRLADAQAGASEASRAFRDIGIDPAELTDAESAFRAIADRFAELEDGSTKTTAALRLFEESGARLIPLLNEGSEGFDRYADEAERFGLLVGRDAAEAAARFNDEINRLQLEITGVGQSIGLELIPAIATFLENVRELRTAGASVIEVINNIAASSNQGAINFLSGTSDIEAQTERVAQLRQELENLEQTGLTGRFFADLIPELTGASQAERVAEATRILAVEQQRLVQLLRESPEGVAAEAERVAAEREEQARRAREQAARAAAERAERVQQTNRVAIERAANQAIIAERAAFTRLSLQRQQAAFEERLQALSGNVDAQVQAINEFYDQSLQTELDRIASNEQAIEQQLQQIGGRLAQATDAERGRILAEEQTILSRLELSNLERQRLTFETEQARQQAIRETQEAELQAAQETIQRFQDFRNRLRQEQGQGAEVERDAARREAAEALLTAQTDEQRQIAQQLLELAERRYEVSQRQQQINRNDALAGEAQATAIAQFENGLLTEIELNEQLEAIERQRLEIRLALLQAQAQQVPSDSPEGLDLRADIQDAEIGLQRLTAAAQFTRDTVTQGFSQFFRSLYDDSVSTVEGIRDALLSIMTGFADRAAQDLAEQLYRGMFTAVDSASRDAQNPVSRLASFVVDTFASVADSIASALSDAFSSAQSSGGGLLSSVGGFLGSLFGGGGGNAAAGAIAAGAWDGGLIDKVAKRFSGGGRVKGPGTSVSDSILARLSSGEFVQRARAVQHYGTDFMEALNSLAIPRDVLRGLSGFADGGLVSLQAEAQRTVPRFQAGGLVDQTAAQTPPTGFGPTTVQVVNQGTPQRVVRTEQDYDQQRGMVTRIILDDMRRNGDIANALANQQNRRRSAG